MQNGEIEFELNLENSTLKTFLEELNKLGENIIENKEIINKNPIKIKITTKQFIH